MLDRVSLELGTRWVVLWEYSHCAQEDYSSRLNVGSCRTSGQGSGCGSTRASFVIGNCNLQRRENSKGYLYMRHYRRNVYINKR